MEITMVAHVNCGDASYWNTSGIKVTNVVTCEACVLKQKKRRMTMEIIIDCDNKGLASYSYVLSKQTGIARDNFKESTDDVDTSVDATRDRQGVDTTS